MESEDEDYEFDVDPAAPFEHDRTVGYRTNRTTSPPSSELGDASDNPIEQPLTPPLFQAMDIPSVRRPPVSVMVPADRVSTHDFPFAESLSAVLEREKYHNCFNRIDEIQCL